MLSIKERYSTNLLIITFPFCINLTASAWP